MTRRICLFLHRWIGLLLAGFLLVVGLTGSLLAFFPELERAINPEFYPVQSSGQRLSAGELAERVEARLPEARVNALYLVGNQGATMAVVSPRKDPQTGQPFSLGFDQIYLDPYTGDELARRMRGVISHGVTNLMQFIYRLHWGLALDKTGIWILGIAALLWTIDCFTSFYLTLPSRARRGAATASVAAPRGPARSFWARWKPAWLVKTNASTYRLNFDLHRAGGLWLWGVLLVFAWSSVYMNLWDTVYTHTTRLAFAYHEPWTDLPLLDAPVDQPRIGWREANRIGERLMDEQAKAHDFVVEQPVILRLDRTRGVYIYFVRSSRDIQDKRGRTRVFFDANDGSLKLVLLPTGQFSGNTITSWLIALHDANVFGLPYRIFVSILGLVIAMLSVTGVYIWWKKRKARSLSWQRRNSPSAAASADA